MSKFLGVLIISGGLIFASAFAVNSLTGAAKYAAREQTTQVRIMQTEETERTRIREEFLTERTWIREQGASERAAMRQEIALIVILAIVGLCAVAVIVSAMSSIRLSRDLEYLEAKQRLMLPPPAGFQIVEYRERERVRR